MHAGQVDEPPVSALHTMVKKPAGASTHSCRLAAIWLFCV